VSSKGFEGSLENTKKHVTLNLPLLQKEKNKAGAPDKKVAKL